MKSLEQILHEYVLEQAQQMSEANPAITHASDDNLSKLRADGSELWVDSGDLKAVAEIWTNDLSALTTNNTLLNREIQKGGYDALIPEIAALITEQESQITPEGLILEINFTINALHALRLAQTFDANVSVELHTKLANEVDRTLAYARRYHAICPDKFFIKIPFTPAGLVATRKLSFEEIPVNMTLGFSVRQNYLAARFANPAYVNVFLGRLNSFVSESGLGSGKNIGERTTMTTQEIIHQIRDAEQARSRLIAASIRSADQMKKLSGVDVMTVPVEVLDQFKQDQISQVEIEKDDPMMISSRPGFSFVDFYGSSIWELEERWQKATFELLAMDVDTLSPEDIVDHYERADQSDFMPRWTVDQVDMILADGKIPRYERWKTQLKTKKVGLDALMNESAIGAFVRDQMELDEHIRELM